MNIYEKIFGELNKAKIKYLVVGGVAVNLYGYMRVTGDIDIVIALDEINLERMDKVMKKLKYSPRLPIRLQTLNDKTQVQKWMKEKNLKAYTYNSPRGGILQLDIVIEESMRFGKIYKQKTVKRINGTNIPLIGFNDLINMKKHAGRQKDIEDTEALLKLKYL